MRNQEIKNKVLKCIIDEYVSTSKPVGSVCLLNKYGFTISSATIRNIMVDLEKDNLIEKSHTSSGRIPTPKGYEFYAKFLTSTEEDKLASKIKDIFANRRSSIDSVIDEAVSLISEASKITVVTSENKNEELLKSITLTPISSKSAIIVLITSEGRVDSKEIQMTSKLNLEDLRIAIRIFQERLHNTKLVDIPNAIINLKPILEKYIKNYEDLIQAFVVGVFHTYKNISHNKVYGKSHLIKSQDIQRQELAQIIELIENQSIWESIDERNYLEENLKLEILPSNASIISKRLTFNGVTKDVSVIGPTKMDYSKAKNILNIIEKYTNELLKDELIENEKTKGE